MSRSLQQIELQRARWRRAQTSLGLADVQDEGFGRGGLAKFVPNLAARLVVLPSDPEEDVLDFDEAFWAWFKAPRDNPFGGQRVDWGYRARSVADGAVKYSDQPDQPDQWHQYCGLTRCGGLDVGLGERVLHPRDEIRGLLLIDTLGRFWWALDLYRGALEKFDISGPWQLTVALVDCKGVSLANLASGWTEPWSGFRSEQIRCLDENARLTIELDRVPAADDMRDLVFRLGAWIEDSCGFAGRRFLTKTGPHEGQFEAGKFS
jgi:hypothetical protein